MLHTWWNIEKLWQIGQISSILHTTVAKCIG